MSNIVKKELKETNLLLKNIPATIMTVFVLSVVLMNIFANKQLIEVGEWLALDCGMLISWVAFFSMDMIVRRFGPKASTRLTIVATLVNLAVSVVFFIVGSIPNNWGEAYMADGTINNQINNALDSTISGTWFVLLGSTVAFCSSAIVHSCVSWLLRKTLKKDDKKTYLICSYVSTSLGQLVDNLVFALIVSLNFFGWNILQCCLCAVTGMLMELIFEFIFAPFGYKITKKWEDQRIGQEYVDIVLTGDKKCEF